MDATLRKLVAELVMTRAYAKWYTKFAEIYSYIT